MPHDWRSAYFLQAKSDYAMFRKLLKDAETPLCQKLHYLQMTTEKMSKGFLTASGAPRYRMSHDAFVTFVKLAKRDPEVRRACGFDNAKPYNAYIDSLAPLASSIENLSPEGPDHPNPEYPWEAGRVVYSPTEYPFSDLQMEGPKMFKMLKFIETCIALV